MNRSVDEFATNIKNAAKHIPIGDHELIRLAVINGLRANIRLHVMQANTKTFDDVLTAARIAEDALTNYQQAEQSSVGDLTKSVAALVEALNKQQQQQKAEKIAAISADDDGQPDDHRPSVYRVDDRREDTRPQRKTYQNTYQRPVINRRPDYSQQDYRSRPTRDHNTNDNGPSCGNCGRQHARGQCFATSSICYNCQKRGHFARLCRSRSAPRRPQNYNQ